MFPGLQQDCVAAPLELGFILQALRCDELKSKCKLAIERQMSWPLFCRDLPLPSIAEGQRRQASLNKYQTDELDTRVGPQQA